MEAPLGSAALSIVVDSFSILMIVLVSLVSEALSPPPNLNLLEVLVVLEDSSLFFSLPGFTTVLVVVLVVTLLSFGLPLKPEVVVLLSNLVWVLDEVPSFLLPTLV